ncbi:MAG: carbohydrate binding domain-containing protein [Lachnospiraceae bacterium]
MRIRNVYLSCFMVLVMLATQVLVPCMGTLQVRAETELPVAVPTEAVPGDILTNGNFVAGTEGWSFPGGEPVASENRLDFKLDAYTIYWAPSIKQEVTLHPNSTYEITYHAIATTDRTVYAGFDNKQDFEKAVLTAGEDKEIKTTYSTGNTAETNAFIICLGAGFETEEDFAAHSIGISAVSIVKTAGEDPKEEEPVGDLDEAETVSPVAENLLQNGHLGNVDTESNTAEGWVLDSFLTGAAYQTEQYRVVYDIKGQQADYQVNMNQKVTLDAAKKYRISFTVESTLDRTVTSGFDPERVNSSAVTKGEKTVISYEYTPIASEEKTFMIYLGGDNAHHKIGISNLSIVVAGDAETGGGNDGDNGGGEQEPVETGLPDAGPTEEVPGNILTNGNFADGTEGWTFPGGEPVASENRLDFKLDAYTIYWAPSIKQEVTLHPNSTYEITYHAIATTDRTVYAGFDNKQDFEKVALTAGEDKEIKTTYTTGATAETNTFIICLGAGFETEEDFVVHSIGISAVSIVKTAGEDSGGDSGEEEPAAGKGDINGDQKITAVDALLVMQHILEEIELNEDQLKRADVDEFAGVTAEDVQAILDYATSGHWRIV